MPALHVFERIDICNQVTALTESTDVFLNSGVFTRLVCQIPVEVVYPNHWGVGNAHIGKNLHVEVTLTKQQLFHNL